MTLVKLRSITYLFHSVFHNPIGVESMIYGTQGEHAHHYTIDAVWPISLTQVSCLWCGLTYISNTRYQSPVYDAVWPISLTQGISLLFMMRFDLYLWHKVSVSCLWCGLTYISNTRYQSPVYDAVWPISLTHGISLLFMMRICVFNFPVLQNNKNKFKYQKAFEMLVPTENVNFILPMLLTFIFSLLIM
jgi:hypothetical protein